MAFSACVCQNACVHQDPPTHHEPGVEQAKECVTRILETCSQDAACDTSELLAVVYAQLRSAAQYQMSLEKPGQTLQATSLVHEAFLKLVGPREVPWKSRWHFYSAAAEAMRQILLDHARSKAAQKRGGGLKRVEITDYAGAMDADSAETLALDAAISRLEVADPEAAAVVRLRFFAGLTGAQTADAMGVSARKVDLVWARARAWLYRELQGRPEREGT